MASTSRNGIIPHNPMDVDEVPQQSTSNLASLPKRAFSVPIRGAQAQAIGHTVGYVYSAEMTSHFCPSGHPEQPERISSIYDIIVKSRCLEKMQAIPIRTVRKEEALLVHSEDHWDKVQAIQCES